MLSSDAARGSDYRDAAQGYDPIESMAYFFAFALGRFRPVTTFFPTLSPAFLAASFPLLLYGYVFLPTLGI